MDSYPIPHLQDFASTLERKTIFSKLDSRNFYSNAPAIKQLNFDSSIPVTKKDIVNTSMTTLFDPYELFKNAFWSQKCNKIDDVLIAFKDETEIYLQEVLQC